MVGLGKQIVVIDRDPARLKDLEYPNVVGDVTRFDTRPRR
ncbi:hypothetical protein [Nocardia vinacea]|nr:hypothetical protein [Nocardia vinacea]